MSFKQENTEPKSAFSVPTWIAAASVASFAVFAAGPAAATIVAVDLTSNAACDGAATCQFAVDSRTMDVTAFKNFPPVSVAGLISYSATRGLGVAENPDGVRIGRNATEQEALQFVVSGDPVTLREIVVFDVDPSGVNTEVTFDLFVDGIKELEGLNGDGLNSALTFDLTGAVALVNDLIGSTFVIVATVNGEAGFHVQALEFDVVDIIDPPPPPPPPPVDLPLPATLGLLGFGLAATGLALRRPARPNGVRRS